MIYTYSQLLTSSATADRARRPPQTICCQKLDSMGYIFVTDSMGLWSWHSWLRKLPFYVIWREMMAIGPFEVNQSHRLWYRSKSRTRHPISEYYLCLTPSFGKNPWSMDCEIWPQRTRLLYHPTSWYKRISTLCLKNVTLLAFATT